MIKFDVTIDIKRSLEDVFAFIVNFENMPRWNYYVTRVDKLSDGPITIGTRFHQVRKTDQQDYRITRLEYAHIIEITTAGAGPKLIMGFDLQQVGLVTRVVDTWTLETSYPKPLEFLAARPIKSAVAENLKKLKELLEERATRLQDGRISRIAQTCDFGVPPHAPGGPASA